MWYTNLCVYCIQYGYVIHEYCIMLKFNDWTIPSKRRIALSFANIVPIYHAADWNICSALIYMYNRLKFHSENWFHDSTAKMQIWFPLPLTSSQHITRQIEICKYALISVCNMLNFKTKFDDVIVPQKIRINVLCC